jgi:hypothetical protein
LTGLTANYADSANHPANPGAWVSKHKPTKRAFAREKPGGGLEKPCKSLGREENHENGLPWARARNPTESSD